MKTEDIVSILSFMDEPRQREVYLRIARAAAIAGKAELAKTAATYAQSLAGTADNALGALADFYGNMASVSTDGCRRRGQEYQQRCRQRTFRRATGASGSGQISCGTGIAAHRIRQA